MTRRELVELLAGPFCEEYARRTAARIGASEADIALLYDTVATPDVSLPARVRHAVAFRGAYVVETLYFASPECFAPFAERFCRRDFAATTDPSARRHLAKIMAHLLGSYYPGTEALETIAESAAAWAVDPAARPAVKIWAMEVVKKCRTRIGWVDEAWDDLLATVVRDAPPSIANRLRNSWSGRNRGVKP